MFTRTILFICLLAALALADNYKVTADILNVRSGPGTSYSVVKKLSRGTTIAVSSVSNGWAKVASGYVSAQFITKSSGTTATPSTTTQTSTSTSTSTSGTPAGGKGGDWPPFVKRLKDIPTFWTYPGGWPTGLIVHFNAGHDKPIDTMNLAKTNKYVYLTMGRDGQVYAAFPPNKGGSHTGTKHHKTSPGIEMCAYGQVTKKSDGSFVTYFGKTVPASDVRYGKRDGSARAGYYHIYTPAQETSLKRMIMWYKWADPNNAFSFDKVLGHDEACDQGGRPGAKTDPGWALSMGMSKLREQLKSEYAALINKSAAEQKAFFGY